MQTDPDPYPRNVRRAFLAGAAGMAAFLVMLFWLAGPADAMPVCGKGKRITCVVDGDTVWVDREKFRLADIDAPDPKGRCPAESRLAALATARLAALLDGPFTIARGDPKDGRLFDRHGRSLAVFSVAGRSVAAALVDEGLARPWAGAKARWC